MEFKTHRDISEQTNSSPNSIITPIILGVITFCLVLWYVILRNNVDLYQNYFCNGAKIGFYLSTALLGVLLCICLRSERGIWYWLAFVICITIVLAVTDRSLSPIDESAHEAIIQYIIDHKKLPTFFDGNQFYYDPATNMTIQGGEPYYEAVQPPLYYLICALVGSVIADLHTRLIVLRLLGILFLVGGMFFAIKAVFTLWPKPTQKMRMYALQTMAILVGMPAVVVRFAHLSNDTMLFLWGGIIVYLCARLIVKVYSAPTHVLLGLVCGLAFVTKNTSAFFAIAILLVGGYYRRLKETLYSLVGLVVIVAPWLLWNVSVYGSLTSMAYHVQFVVPIVNPTGESYDWILMFFSRFWQGFWQPQEVVLNGVVSVFNSFWAVLLTIWLFVLGVKTIKGSLSILISKFQFSYEKEERYEVLTLLMGWFVLCSIIVLFLGCLSTGINGLLGRYIHCLIPALSIIFPVFVSKIEPKIWNYWQIMIGLFLGALMTVTLMTYLWQCFPLRYQNETVPIANVSDANWNNGISLSGDIILLDREIFYDYQSLEGQLVSTDEQNYSLVTNVENKGSQIWVYLDQAIDNSGSGSLFIQYK